MIANQENIYQNKSNKIDISDINKTLYIFEKSEIHNVATFTDRQKDFFYTALKNKTSRFESLDALDVICTYSINYEKTILLDSPTYFFIQKQEIFIIYPNKSVLEIILHCLTKDSSYEINIGKILHGYYEKSTENDFDFLETIEHSVIDLEDKIILNLSEKNYIRNIIKYRKHLLILKKYYEQIIDILSYIISNENAFYDKKTIKLINILMNKIERLFNNVLNLKDYVTQIREAYQSEVDISLNSTMKLFTVITTIFLPLTLIAGWYGMNLDMPEYSYPYSYLIVIILSIVIVFITIFYFKKNKWF